MSIHIQSDLLKKRSLSTVWVTWLAKVLADPAQCKLPVWTLTRFSITKDSGYTGDWATNHAAIIEKIQARLNAANRKSELEREISVISKTQLLVTGMIDVWAPGDGNAISVIIDAKTGKYSPSHRIQVNIYQLMAKQIGLSKDDSLPAGMLCYQDRDVWIKPEEASPVLASRLENLLALVAKDDQPAASPSKNNCRFCSLKAACSTAWKPSEINIPAIDLF